MKVWELHPVNEPAEECIPCGCDELFSVVISHRLASVGTGGSQSSETVPGSHHTSDRCELGNRMGASQAENEVEPQFCQLAAREGVPAH